MACTNREGTLGRTASAKVCRRAHSGCRLEIRGADLGYLGVKWPRNPEAETLPTMWGSSGHIPAGEQARLLKLPLVVVAPFPPTPGSQQGLCS